MNEEKNALRTRFIGLAVVVSFGLTAHPALASLGSFPLNGANVHVSSNVMKSAAVVKEETASQTVATTPSPTAAYTVNVVILNSGTVVHEFVAASSDTVFAVTWSGPQQPDFVDILGTYSERYLKPSGADAIHAVGLNQRSLNASDLVVQSFGHPGRFKGYAYLPSAVPAGVSLSKLQ
ncbi:DUF2844 domain-containing protein [Paraburkholderia rhizosphaerae]|uniref:Uncharacterized protein DUF2844 n=1 Tax=Paraburkholderia rhizosphaerae TaxID=480658 RepID=A0A4R8LX34_9BURK|nr:DUF2844 domain-containing protein [Paraburkholderia rhizosphaerae]TDY52222.1 uncharacterized protein DUF2844 [Paraburkholderia rhizosphaerae]